MTVLMTLAAVIVFALAMAAAVLLLIFVLVPIFRGVGWLLWSVFRGIGWLVAHVFEFIGGTISDALRFVGSVIATLILAPMSILNVLIGRWSAAGHFADSVRRECKVGLTCLYRISIRRPLKLFMLHGLLEGVEQRVPEAMAAAPVVDRPGKGVGQFAGYTIVGSLRGGGSGAKLFIAQPDVSVRERYPDMPDRVVIKCFALSEGSSLPQMLRESRALECAKQLGLVYEHSIDERRFFYVMPYHAGDHLGIITRQLHGESGDGGLGTRQLAMALGYVGDLVNSLARYHRGGLWHKDVKPDNVIVHSGRAHLVDLGLVTPLRSAMTLTTHGTEYFRDPEMVRQALRGVKVHQINGAKFDIYAAGAVLYFMTENTFPAHGALSRFQRHSPDALRWIIRRAMADYSHRYETADDMLADLRHVAAAADPFAVKPAELPSLGGSSVPPLVEADAQDVAARPTPEPLPRPAANAAAVAPPSPPALEVTNWWTGAYRVASPRAARRHAARTPVPPPEMRTAVFREQARALRHEAAQLRQNVRSGRLSARKAAREQVRAARARAHEIRRRTRAHRRERAVAERQPSGMLIAIGVLAVVAMIGAVAMVLAAQTARGGRVSVVTNDTGRPVLIVDSNAEPDPARAEWLERLTEQYTHSGYDVIANMPEASEHLHDLLGTWQYAKGIDKNAYRAADEALEEALDTLNLYGFLFVQETDHGLGETLIYSDASGAELRRHVASVSSPPTPLPYLLINDHPTRSAPATAAALASRLGEYELRGWNVTSDDDLEAEIRMLLPAGPVGAEHLLPARLFASLDDAGYGGILYVEAGDGEGSADERLGIRVIQAAERPASPAPAAANEASGSSCAELALARAA